MGWVKSSFSSQGNCVEVQVVNGTVRIRDSKNPGGPVLEFPEVAWNEWLAGLHAGEMSLEAFGMSVS